MSPVLIILSCMKILVTHPGKFGDLIYALPAVIELQKLFKCDVYFQTSGYCRPLVGLLNSQPYIKRAFVCEDYVLERFSPGCQPWKMSEPEGYAKVYHLGIRPAQKITHLIDAPFDVLKSEYGIDLPVNRDQQYLFMSERKFNYDYTVFNIYGESVAPINPCSAAHFSELWGNIFKAVDEDFVAVAGLKDKSKYDEFKDLRLVCPPDFLQTAQIINDARCFVGVQSASAAIANGLKVPRVILHWYENAVPTGGNFERFGLTEPVSSIIKKLNKYVKIKSNLIILKGLGKERVLFK